MEVTKILEDLQTGAKAWSDLTLEEVEAVFNYYTQKPGSIEHAALNTGYGADQIRTAAGVLRAIRDGMHGDDALEWSEVTAEMILSILDMACRLSS